MKDQEITAQSRKTEFRNDGRFTHIPSHSAPRFGMENIHLKFCKEKDVNKNKRINIKTKSTFLVKLNNMKTNGQNIKKHERID